MLPTVSVCIPSFNHARFIGECIESVLSQSIQDFEVLVTDDASSDHSMDVIKAFKDPRVKVERHATTLGPSAAINSAVRRARGKYVAILGSDFNFRNLTTDVTFDAGDAIDVQIGRASCRERV